MWHSIVKILICSMKNRRKNGYFWNLATRTTPNRKHSKPGESAHFAVCSLHLIISEHTHAVQREFVLILFQIDFCPAHWAHAVRELRASALQTHTGINRAKDTSMTSPRLWALWTVHSDQINRKTHTLSILFKLMGGIKWFVWLLMPPAAFFQKKIVFFLKIINSSFPLSSYAAARLQRRSRGLLFGKKKKPTDQLRCTKSPSLKSTSELYLRAATVCLKWWKWARADVCVSVHMAACHADTWLHHCVHKLPMLTSPPAQPPAPYQMVPPVLWIC